MKNNKKRSFTILLSCIAIAAVLMGTAYAGYNIFGERKAADASSSEISSYTPQRKPQVSKSFDIDKATELISKYYDYKSVVEYSPNEFLSYAGFSSESTIKKSYEIDNTSWVFWDQFQIELWKYFSFDLVVSDFAKHYEISEFQGSKTVNYYGKEKADAKTEYTVLDINSLKETEDGFTCKGKIASKNGSKSDTFEKDFNFIFYNNIYQLAEII